MSKFILTVVLAFVPLVMLAQEQKPSQTSDQEKKPAAQPAAPVSISPLVPVGTPKPGAKPDIAPGSPGAATMAAGMAGAKPGPIAPVSSRTYIIGAEDVIGVTVFENPAFAVTTEAVRPDGKITMPLLGEVVASGKTPEELADEIQKILVDRYMKEPPHVQVIVHEVRSKNYYIQGEVNHPGKFALVVPTTIMQALVNAGGFKDFANKKDIRIQRVGQDKIIHFNYNDVSKGKHLDQDILLQPDDQIFVR